jgi:Cathepsin propeptide inhibitor domain (I29)
MAAHSKSYATVSEFQRRREVFAETYRYIEERNSNETQAREGLTYKLGLNKFADWTREEREKIRGGAVKKKRQERPKRNVR